MKPNPVSLLYPDMAPTILSRQTIQASGAFSTILIHVLQVKMTLEEIRADIEAAVPGCHLEIIPNSSPSGQRSLLIEPARTAVEVAQFLRDNVELCLDYCSNVTGIDWLDT